MMLTITASGAHNARMTIRRHHSQFLLSLLLLLCLMAPVPAWSWNAAGHRLIASIAWEQLNAQARAETLRLLRMHPDHERWMQHGGHEQGEQTAFIEASTWPDDIRQDTRFYDAESEQATAIQAGFPDMRRHRSWHYVNRPFADTSAQPVLSGELDTQLGILKQTLSAQQSLDQERAYALPWLIHLVGDAHQPLHAIVQSNNGPSPGVSPAIINPFNPRKNASTLHAFWDDLPGPPWLRGDRLRQRARALAARYSPSDRSLQTDVWIKESWLIARTQGFPNGEEEPVSLTADFFINSREIANRRIAEAGYRLAGLLNALFSRTR